MKKSILLLTIIVLFGIMAGCGSAGLTASTHFTNVGLSDNNYRLVATSISGEAMSEGILGISLGMGMGGGQFSLIPLTDDRTLYKNAMQNLWTNFEAKNGGAADHTYALINLRYDAETLNTIIYTKLRVVVIADVVEFK